MYHTTRHSLFVLPLLMLTIACGDGAIGTGSVDGGGGGGGGGTDADVIDLECEPPDFMVLLDRTGSMAKRPDGSLPPNTASGANESKWSMAVSSLKSLTASREDSMRFGLVLFPLDPDGDNGTDCSNLNTWLKEYLPPESNDPVCMPAELLVSPVLNSASEIDAAIGRDTTGLCSFTPIGAGLNAVRDGLAAIKVTGRDQYALLITDGADTCDHRDTYSSKSLDAADRLRGDQVKTFVVGFDGSGEGVDEEHLNHLACAGGTATNQTSNCVSVNGKYRAVTSPSPARLFLMAEDGVALGQQLEQVTSQVCCGCVD